jgi:hypothetical protein
MSVALNSKVVAAASTDGQAPALVPDLPLSGHAHGTVAADEKKFHSDGEDDDESAAAAAAAAGQKIKVIPLHIRWIAFSFILFISTGSAFAESIVGPLKSTLLRELKINSESSYRQDDTQITR